MTTSATTRIFANGSATVTIAAGDKIAVQAANSSAQIWQQVALPNYPSSWTLLTTVTNQEYVSSAFSSGGVVRIDAGPSGALYATGTVPRCVNLQQGVLAGGQVAPIAKTTDVTLTGAELLAGIITVNQGAAGASALTLPLATAMDTAMPEAVAGTAFDFSVINISTVAAEDATVTTNTGWTLVGGMVVESRDSDRANSSGRFRARKTATGAWTLYRLA